jgi:2-polyprenyl-6-methoxyphenol hydroxylase-like FAD-dependent oxidoreductase
VDFKAPTELMLPISSKPDPRNNCSPSQSRQLHAALSAMDPMRRNLHDQLEETLLGTPLGTKARSRSIAGMSGKLGRRAVVVGAGIGGLSAAGVLAKYFDQVDVLERDQTPLSAETRSGTPQDNHAHGLLAGGLQALNEIYPDFDRDLAAAASGRGALTLDFLRMLGWEQPATTRLGVDITYSTAIVTIPAHLALDWKVALTLPDPPYQPLNAVLLPAEGNRWMISVADRGITGRIDSWDAFLDALGRLTTTTLRDALQHAHPPSIIRHYRFPASIWRHFERLARLPRGMIPLGDSVCQFNPIYGQGMSAAAQQSRLLQTVLTNVTHESDPVSSAQAAFMSGVESVLQTPWTMALNSDLAFPQTQATRPDNFGRTQQSQAALLQTIVNDPVVHRAFVEVSHLLQPYSLLRTPAIRERIEAAAAAK